MVTLPVPAKTSEKKRKRSKQDEIDDELSELNIGDLDMPTEPRRKKKTRVFFKDGSSDDDLPHPTSFAKASAMSKAIKTKKASGQDGYFSFSAVIDYDAKGRGIVHHFMPSEDVLDCEFLWDRIRLTKNNIWEQKAGEDWQFIFFNSDYKPAIEPCVTRKLAHKKTDWRPGFEATHACKDCVKNGRPCFVWIEEKSSEWRHGEFRLLPLHDKDRTRLVVKDKTEVRYWINDDTEFNASDVVRADEDDEDYVD